MRLRNLFFVLLVALVSVFAASYSNTIVMNMNGFDVQQYDCLSDKYCNNPSLMLDTNTASNSYTFNSPTNNFYAEYLFKEGYLPKGFVVHRYNGVDNFNFNKKESCFAPINNVEISNNNITQGDEVLVNVNVESALHGADDGTPNYRPLDHIDWFDADTIVRLRLMQGDNIVLEQEQSINIFIDSNEDVEFNIDTTGLSGDYDIVVETEVVDEMCADSQIIIYEDNIYVNEINSETPEVNFNTNSIDLCQYEDFTFDNYEVYDDGSIVNYEWDFDNDGIVDSYEQYPTYNFSNLGNNLVTLTVRDYMNLTSFDTLLVNVTDCTNQDTIYVNIEADPEEGEAPLDVDFSAQITGGTQPYSYEWDFDNDGITDSTDDNPSYEFDDEGDYIVRLTVTDDNGNTGSDSIVISVDEEDLEDSEESHSSHDLIIEEVLSDDEVNEGDMLNLNLKLRNSGDYTEKDVTLLVQIEELGTFTKLTGFDMTGDRSIWKQVSLEIPNNIEGQYTIKATLYNDYHSDIYYKTISVKGKEDVWVSVSNTDEKKTDWLRILELGFLVLLISLLIVGIIIIMRRLLLKQ